MRLEYSIAIKSMQTGKSINSVNYQINIWFKIFELK